MYPRNHPERADDIDAAIGELSVFHGTHGYYAHGVSPKKAILPVGWEQRLVRVFGPNTEGATGLCLNVHDLVLSKYAAGREKDLEFNRAVIQYGCVTKWNLTRLVPLMAIGNEAKRLMLMRIKSDFAAAHPRSMAKS